MANTVRNFVVLFSICSCVCGCAHRCVYYAAVGVPPMKTLYEVASNRNTLGPSFLNKDEKAHAFYTCETACDQSRTFIACYDYDTGYKWEGEIPLVVGNYALWCVGNEAYVGGNSNVWRGRNRAPDLYGCVCRFNLECPSPELEVVIPPERRDDCCREIAAYDDNYLAFLYGPDHCGEKFSSCVIFDPVRKQVVEKKCFSDEAGRLSVLSRCMRRGSRCRVAVGKFAKEVTADGCLFYDDHFRLVSKVQADAIEKLFLVLLESQNEEYMRKSRQGKYFSDSIRKWYHSEFVADGKVMFWNIYGSWFVYDINANEVVDSGVVKLNIDERLVEFIDLNCFLLRARRSNIAQFFTWDFSEMGYELVFVEKGSQKRKSIPGLRWAFKLTDKIYCLDFKG